MARVLVSECKQEIASFNPVLGNYEDFKAIFGGELLSYHRGLGTEVGGALSVFDDHSNVELVGGYSARGITSGGTVSDVAFERIAREFLDAVRNAGHLDGIYFSLHGACASQTEHDVEGYLLEETRKIVGNDIPIVASFDLHGILTDRMLKNSNAITVFHTYPHVDFYQTGQRAARLLVRLLAGEIRPVIARVFIPALVRGNELITETGLFGNVVREAIAVENSQRGLSAAMFIGNPFTDVLDLGTNSVVITDGDVERAKREAIRLANDFWEVHEKLQSKLVSMEETIRLANETKGRVVLVDAADATSSGASGDSNAILRALVDAGFRRTTLIPLVDPPAVKAAFAAGVGATIKVSVGGAMDPRYRPLPVEGQVTMLSDGKFRSESHGDVWNSGDTAVLKVDNYTLILTSRAVSLYDRSLFLAHGLDPAQFDATVVKSPHCQPRFFNDGAGAVINVDAPGATSANVRSLGHKRCRRPIFPLDENVAFTPEPHVFQFK
jgi:microcystin degradation protein MlrC